MNKAGVLVSIVAIAANVFAFDWPPAGGTATILARSACSPLRLVPAS